MFGLFIAGAGVVVVLYLIYFLGLVVYHSIRGIPKMIDKIAEAIDRKMHRNHNSWENRPKMKVPGKLRALYPEDHH